MKQWDEFRTWWFENGLQARIAVDAILSGKGGEMPLEAMDAAVKRLMVSLAIGILLGSCVAMAWDSVSLDAGIWACDNLGMPYPDHNYVCSFYKLQKEHPTARISAVTLSCDTPGAIQLDDGACKIFVIYSYPFKPIYSYPFKPNDPYGHR